MNMFARGMLHIFLASGRSEDEVYPVFKRGTNQNIERVVVGVISEAERRAQVTSTLRFPMSFFAKHAACKHIHVPHVFVEVFVILLAIVRAGHSRPPRSRKRGRASDSNHSMPPRSHSLTQNIPKSLALPVTHIFSSTTGTGRILSRMQNYSEHT